MKLRLSPTDPSLEKEGVWRTFCGVDLLIARRNNPEFVDAMTPPPSLEGEEETSEERRARTIDAMARYILIGWRGWEVDGEPVEYSVENARNLLAHDYDAREFVSRASMERDAYIRRETEEMAGNS